MRPLPKNSMNGFTVVEAVVTLIVAAVFLLVIYQLFVTNIFMSVNTRQAAAADDIAYQKLREFVNGDVTAKTWTTPFSCSTGVGAANTNDLTVNSNAPGQIIVDMPVAAAAKLPAGARITVKAFAPYGCSGVNADKPIRVESTVTYGSRGVTHAALQKP